MTITIFGATGRSGLPLIKELLNKGFKVKALVRDESKLGEFKNKINYIIGSLDEKDKVRDIIKDSNCVISVIGHTKNSVNNFQVTAIRMIMESMNEFKVKRLIVLTGAGVFAEGDKPGLIDKFVTSILKIVSKDRILDGINYVEEIKKSKLEWTVVRVPILTQDQHSNVYKVGMVGNKDMQMKISRNDLAKFLVEIISDNSQIHKLPYVAWGK